MKAIGAHNQLFVETTQAQLTKNLLNLPKLITNAQKNIQELSIDRARNQVIEAYQLAFQSLSLAFVAIDGPDARVCNEESDGRKHRQLKDASSRLFDVYCSLLKLTPDCHTAKNKLTHILNIVKTIN
jgi:hypothetical protein